MSQSYDFNLRSSNFCHNYQTICWVMVKVNRLLILLYPLPLLLILCLSGFFIYRVAQTTWWEIKKLRILLKDEQADKRNTELREWLEGLKRQRSDNINEELEPHETNVDFNEEEEVAPEQNFAALPVEDDYMHIEDVLEEPNQNVCLDVEPPQDALEHMSFQQQQQQQQTSAFRCNADDDGVVEVLPDPDDEIVEYAEKSSAAYIKTKKTHKQRILQPNLAHFSITQRRSKCIEKPKGMPELELAINEQTVPNAESVAVRNRQQHKTCKKTKSVGSKSKDKVTIKSATRSPSWIKY